MLAHSSYFTGRGLLEGWCCEDDGVPATAFSADCQGPEMVMAQGPADLSRPHQCWGIYEI